MRWIDWVRLAFTVATVVCLVLTMRNLRAVERGMKEQQRANDRLRGLLRPGHAPLRPGHAPPADK